MSSYQVIVIGAGAAGSAAAYELAKEGAKTLLIEQYAIGHNRGSSHGASRIFRFAYPEVEYMRFARLCLPLWRELEAESGTQLLTLTGGLDFADDEHYADDVRAVYDNLLKADCTADWLDGQALRKRFPQWKLPEQACGTYSPDTGVLNADLCVHTLVTQAKRHGATVMEGQPVLAIEPQSTGAVVRTAAGDFGCERLVITAGAWLNTLLKPLGMALPLKVTQEQYAFFAAKNPTERPPNDPIWIHYRENIMYGFPDLGQGFKAGWHHANVQIDIADYRQQPDQTAMQAVTAYLQAHRPDLVAQPQDTATCVYTSTPDHEFVIDFLPGHPGIVVGSPCSGHGFKFAVGTGKILADLALRGRTDMGLRFPGKWA
jgi:monomeric sarcosine oxidase